jgi:shikimate 5-dehydrogenase
MNLSAHCVNSFTLYNRSMHWKEATAAQDGRARYAVIGDLPDSEILTKVFDAGFRTVEANAEVILLECEREQFPDCVTHLNECKFKGISVGNPHKPVAAKLATQFFIVKHSLGVANALALGPDIFAQNTEVPGFRRAIADVTPATALVMGSGRAARSAVMGLFESGWQVKLWNRNFQRSKPLVSLFLRYGKIETAHTADPTGCSLIVNATPVGRKAGEEPPIIWRYARPKTTIVDFVYRAVATEFLRSGARLGFNTIDGKELLVEQAAFAIEWWLQKPCARAPMLEAINFHKPIISARL